MRKIFGFVTCMILLSVLFSGCISDESNTEDVSNTVVENKDTTSEVSAEPQDVSDTSSTTADTSVADTPEVAVDPVADYYGDGYSFMEVDSKFEDLFGPIDGYRDDNSISSTGSFGLYSDNPEFKGESFYYCADYTNHLSDSAPQLAFEKQFFEIASVDFECYRDWENDAVRTATAEASLASGLDLKWNDVAVTAHGYNGESKTIYAPFVGDDAAIYLDVAVNGLDNSAIYQGKMGHYLEAGVSRDYFELLEDTLNS